MSTSWKERAEEIGSTAAWRCHVLYIALHLPKPPTAERMHNSMKVLLTYFNYTTIFLLYSRQL